MVLILGANSTNIGRAILLQNRIIRIMIGVGTRCSCKGLFKKLYVLPVPYLYILCDCVIVNKLENFQTNSSLNCINTRNNSKLHRHTANLSCIQKGVTLV